MKETGFTEMKGVAQGAKTLSLPMQFLGADLQVKRINYNNNPILRWCLSNTGVQEDRNGNIVPVKNQAAKQRIDGTASLLNAYVGLSVCIRHFHEPRRNVLIVYRVAPAQPHKPALMPFIIGQFLFLYWRI